MPLLSHATNAAAVTVPPAISDVTIKALRSRPFKRVTCIMGIGVRITLGISCEAPKLTGLRQLHPLVRRLPRILAAVADDY
jgi:hypothetical protein